MVGFDCQNKNLINQEYVCATCKLLLRDPLQLGCGHRFCKSCISENNSGMITCFTCGEGIMTDEICLDRGVMNDMKTVAIICHCGWNGNFKNYQNHSNDHRLLISNSEAAPIKKSTEANNKMPMEEVLKLKTSENKSQSEDCTFQTSIEEKCEFKDLHMTYNDSIVSYGNGLLWRVGNINEILNKEKFSVTSKTFYTSSGYKMCVRLYSNNVHTGQSIDISVALFLMPGEKDSIIKWPFKHQVAFALLNVNNQKDHIVGSFLSETNILTVMNLAGVITEFIPLSKLKKQNSHFIADDTLFLKMLIMNDSVPKFILPSIMGIDHGLPLYKQQEEIEKELMNMKQKRSYELVLKLKLKQ